MVGDVGISVGVDVGILVGISVGAADGEAVDICMQASVLKGNTPLLVDKYFKIEMLLAAIGGVVDLIRPELAVE